MYIQHIHTFFLKPILAAALTVMFAVTVAAQTDTAKSDAAKASPIKAFDAFFKDKPVVSDSGMFIVHQADHRYYFEIPDSMLHRDMLMVSTRMAMSSSDFDQTVAGERTEPGLMLRWEKSPDDKQILLRKVTSRNVLRFTGTDTAFRNAVALQTVDPILLAFPIKATAESGNAIIDIHSLYVPYIEELGFFGKSLMELLTGKTRKYKVEENRSYITSTQSFEKNIEVRSLLTVTEGTNLYTISVNRSLVLLPEQPMMPRYADNRVGYFVRSFHSFDESQPVKQRFFINRWRLEPKPEDRTKMERGELVEPQQPIVFYIDASTPAKWREYIRKGVEDWIPAFEAAGFKNAIQAKDAPVDDPAFNPEDVRYSVIRYTASPIANAKGPSVFDPRSGEILESDVILYHNVLKLLAEWRFSQTAAVDPAARTTDIADEMLGDALRYVTAHEIGHSLGLRHNMAASAAFPVDSLRSATFTQKYGTTPSIMDYARFNYVAQPGDKGVKLTPPRLGMYDTYAIHWGYRPIPGAQRPEDEAKTLNQWIAKHADDPRFRFGEGDVNGTDPTSQRESLGDDVVKASEYGAANIRYILAHLPEWFAKPGEDYQKQEEALLALLKQYERYLLHVSTAIAGVEQYYPVQGQEQPMYRYADRETQQRAVAFLLEQLLEAPVWLGEAVQGNLQLTVQTNGVKRIVPVASYFERLYKKMLQSEILNNGKLAYLWDNQLRNGPDAYGPEDLLNDLRSGLFTSADDATAYYRQVLQAQYVDRLIAMSGIRKDLDAGSKALADGVNGEMLIPHGARHEQCCLQAGDDGAFSLMGHDELYFQYKDMQMGDKRFLIERLTLAELRSVQAQVEQLRRKAKGTDRDHYDYLLKRISFFLSAQ